VNAAAAPAFCRRARSSLRARLNASNVPPSSANAIRAFCSRFAVLSACITRVSRNISTVAASKPFAWFCYVTTPPPEFSLGWDGRDGVLSSWVLAVSCLPACAVCWRTQNRTMGGRRTNGTAFSLRAPVPRPCCDTCLPGCPSCRLFAALHYHAFSTCMLFCYPLVPCLVYYLYYL